MSRWIILLTVKLAQHHKPTGRTSHYVSGSLMEKPDTLQIVRYEGGTGYYLLYMDRDGNDVTDTYHDSLEGALDQAHWEFGIEPEEWSPVLADENQVVDRDS